MDLKTKYLMNPKNDEDKTKPNKSINNQNNNKDNNLK